MPARTETLVTTAALTHAPGLSAHARDAAQAPTFGYPNDASSTRSGSTCCTSKGASGVPALPLTKNGLVLTSCATDSPSLSPRSAFDLSRGSTPPSAGGVGLAQVRAGPKPTTWQRRNLEEEVSQLREHLERER